MINHSYVEKGEKEEICLNENSSLLLPSVITDKNFKKISSVKLLSNRGLPLPNKENNKKTKKINFSQIPVPKSKTERAKQQITKNKLDNHSQLKTLETITYLNTYDINSIHNEKDLANNVNNVDKIAIQKQKEKELMKKSIINFEKKSSKKSFELMMKRMKTFVDTKEKKLEIKKNEIKLEIDKSKTKCPKINENSKKMTTESFFERQERYKKAKEEKKKILKQVKEENKKQNVQSKKVNKSVIETNINNQLKWDNERKQKILSKKEKELIEETKECTFKPEINNYYKISNKSISDRLNEGEREKAKDDIKIDLNKNKRENEFVIPKPFKKHDSCKLYRSLYQGENEILIIENMFNEKFKDLSNRLY